MSPFRAKPGWTYKLKIRLPDGRSATCTCGTRDTEIANAVEAMVHTLMRKRKWEVLTAVVDKQLALPDVFDAFERKHLAGVDALLETLNDTDLSPLVDTLLDNEKYRAQVRRLIPANTPFPASQFTTPTVSAFLRTLTNGQTIVRTPASPSTRARHRAALSQFAKALIEAGHLTTNPVRDVATIKQPKRRITFLAAEQVQALVPRLSQPYRALEAIMAGTGMEWGAVSVLTRQDIDVETRVIHARGEKNEYRHRYVAVSEAWAWAIILDYVKVFLPTARLFDGVTAQTALAMHRRESKALGLPPTTLHQLRHSFAVMHFQRGTDHQWIKNQLGHAPDSTMLYKVYGVYINAAKLTKQQAARLGKQMIESTDVSTAREVNSR